MLYIELTEFSRKGESCSRFFLNKDYIEKEKLQKEVEIFQCSKREIGILQQQREVLTNKKEIKLTKPAIARGYSRYSMQVAYLHSGDRIFLDTDANWKIKYSRLSWIKEFLYKLAGYNKVYQAAE